MRKVRESANIKKDPARAHLFTTGRAAGKCCEQRANNEKCTKMHTEKKSVANAENLRKLEKM